ncbi:MAG: polysaccharide biosynthesis protein [Lactobacillales bacterium]|jgi:O-antigen/teichoic acid export membrane protein|nr:polysaccharide biosynthesis protein [Lactobacillales bacterium]
MNENVQETEVAMKQLVRQKNQMVKGVFWLSASNLISRFLGAIYVIPWYAWLQPRAEEGNSLFSKGYEIYAWLLLISTSGIPALIAKKTAQYNSLNEFESSQRLFRDSLKTMAALGGIFAALMFFGAPWLVSLIDGQEELITVMRSLAPAIFFFPMMSVLRGYFQGNNNMMPYALSQIVEQIMRVVWMLLAVYIIMKVQHGSFVNAVIQSTLAAFIGVLGSLVVLLYFFREQQVKLRKKLRRSRKLVVRSKNLDMSSSFFSIIKEAIPFIISGSGIQLFRLIDLGTFNRMMSVATNQSKGNLERLYTLFSANPSKLVMIIIAFSTAISFTGLPLITESHTLKNFRELSRLVGNNIQLFLFVMLPAVFGMLILAHPLNTCFYGESNYLGISLLSWSILQALLLAGIVLTTGVLQGLSLNSKAIRYLVLGMFVKIILQFPMIVLFKVYGPLVSTTIGMGLVAYLNFRKICLETRIDARKLVKACRPLFFITIVMVISTLLTRSALYIFLNPDRRISSFMLLLLISFVGGSVYLFVAFKFRIADRLLGKRIERFKRWLPF